MLYYYYYYVLRDSMVSTRKKTKIYKGKNKHLSPKKGWETAGEGVDKSDLLHYRACEIRILSFISWWRKMKINKRGTQSLYTDRGEVFTLFSKVSRRFGCCCRSCYNNSFRGNRICNF